MAGRDVAQTIRGFITPADVGLVRMTTGPVEPPGSWVVEGATPTDRMPKTRWQERLSPLRIGLRGWSRLMAGMLLIGAVLVIADVFSIAARGAQTRSPADHEASAPQPSRVILDERFVNSRRSWPNNLRSTAWLENGGYHLFARQPGQFVAVGAPATGRLGDVVVTATFRKVGGPPGGGYGVIVRDAGPSRRDGISQTGRYYVLEVGDKGEVGIWRREHDHWVDLVPWTRANVVRPGSATNELKVSAVGPLLTLTVNGTEVASVSDAALSEGTVGVFVGGDHNEVLLERYTVLAPG